ERVYCFPIDHCVLPVRISDVLFLCFFFFQAEDGIRDATVTGVQTCALPICQNAGPKATAFWLSARPTSRPTSSWLRPTSGFARRSEERRVGKECRCRVSRDPSKSRTAEDIAARRQTAI